MAQTTTNYGLYKPESTDTYNHLVYDNPNMDTIDGVMKDNADHTVDNATCIKSGTVHSVTRTNTSCPVFKFTATGDWNTGDTMNVDGTPVSVYLPNGTAPLTGCFVINSEVLAIISGSRVTLQCPVVPTAAQISFDNTGSTLTATQVENALKQLNDSDYVMYDSTRSVKQMIATTPVFATVTGNFAATIGNFSSITYPTGFNAINSKVVGFEIYANDVWRSGQGVMSAGSRSFEYLGSSNIQLYNDDPNLTSAPVRIVLMA